MRVLFALGNVAEKGGWAAYARALRPYLEAHGCTVQTVAYPAWLLRLPIGIRHALYFLMLLPKALGSDVILAFDTWSTGLPALIASRCTSKPLVVRIGGDFLWEQYVERTGHLVKLSNFYTDPHVRLNHKERIIRSGTKMLLQEARAIAFNSIWQLELWRSAYGLTLQNAVVIENAFPARKESHPAKRKNFVAAGRPIRLKNEQLLREVFKDIQKDHPDIELDTLPLSPNEHQNRIANCYVVIQASISDVSPNAISDAVAYGKPFIAPLDSGLAQRLEGTGLFVDTTDAQALRKAIVTLLDPVAYEQIATAVLDYSGERPIETVSAEFLELLQRTVTQKGAR